MKSKSLIFLQINELNFDLVSKYADKYGLPNLSKILSWHQVTLTSEEEYEKLEPWIQWVSVSTGLSAQEHGVFRLGDIEKFKLKQIYETVEEMGYNVIALSPMNVKNNLEKSNFFLPDPWTNTKVNGNWLDKKIYTSLKQAVNDNSNGRITKLSLFFLLLGVIRYSNFKNWKQYFYLAFSAKNKKWNKALFLDLFLSDYFVKKSRLNKTNFSVLFLNSLAHIQHHYYKNSEFCIGTDKNPDWLVSSKEDPLLDGLKILDVMVGDLLSISRNRDVLIATGLSQDVFNPFQYYYRLKNHKEFLFGLNINFKNVYPRMTRDFEVSFNNNNERDICANALSKVRIDGKKCFGVIEKRERSLFVTLTHSEEIINNTLLTYGKDEYFAQDVLSFVALKNGHHSPNSWAFCSTGIAGHSPKEGQHVKSLHNTIKNYFSEGAA